MFTFHCPHCGNAVEADESAIGEVADCPFCSTSIEVKRDKTLVVHRAPRNFAARPQYAKPTTPSTIAQQVPEKKHILEFFIGFFGVVISWFTGSHDGAKTAAMGCLVNALILIAIFCIVFLGLFATAK